MTIRLYLDEDVDVALAMALRQRGIDVLATQEAGNLGLRDEDQVAFATQAGRGSAWPRPGEEEGEAQVVREGQAQAVT